MQRFASAGDAPSRDSGALAFHAAVGAVLALSSAYYATCESMGDQALIAPCGGATMCKSSMPQR